MGMIIIISALASLLSFRLRSRTSLELELVALRHRVAVLRRQHKGRGTDSCVSANYVVFLNHRLCARDVCVVPLNLLVIRAFQVRANTLFVVPLCLRNIFAGIMFGSKHALRQAARLLDHERGAFLFPIAFGLVAHAGRDGRNNHSNNRH
jgi:hypothetical protein